MTEELFPTDAYLRSCEATVRDAGDEGVVLDRTVFYARSGGQPGDSGELRWEGGDVRVLDTLKRGGRLLHEVDGDPPAPGIDVTAEIDWDRRHALMRTHTALHALSAVVFRDYDAKVTGGNMEPGVARMDSLGTLDREAQVRGSGLRAGHPGLAHRSGVQPQDRAVEHRLAGQER